MILIALKNKIIGRGRSGAEKIQSRHWHNLSVERVFHYLKANKKGLSRNEAEKRLDEFGLNEIPEKKKFSYLKIFLSQFKNALIFVLIIAALITVFIGEYIDGYVILAAIFINIVFGFLQEAKAEKSLLALKKIVKEEAIVLRDNEEEKIDALKIALGDIVILETGNKVLADLRIIESEDLEINESVITGESMSVSKIIEPLPVGTNLADQKNMSWMGSVVAKGRGKGIVIATGLKSQFGKIFENLSEIKDEDPPIKKKIASLARILIIAIVIVSAAIFLLGLAFGRDISEIFVIAVSLAVAAIPEGLVVAVTITMAIGMQRVLKKNALIRNLIAAETLGSTTVICSDKTGTITKGEMHVSEIIAGGDSMENKIEVLKSAMFASSAVVENPADAIKSWRIRGDATEKAVIEAAFETGLHQDYLKKNDSLIKIFSDRHEKKYVAISYELSDKKNIVYFKGAPEVILKNSKYFLKDGATAVLSGKYFNEFEKKYKNLSEKGFRVLAAAKKEISKEAAGEDDLLFDVVFCGFLALTDPIRENAVEAINEAKEAGIKTVMITGDNILTARTISGELGIAIDNEKIIDGSNLQEMSDEELAKNVGNISVYARITPRDKLRIVEAFQKNGDVVAVTGDGVNDVLAIKKADIGISVGSGTDVAKEASDMIILDNDFKSIVGAVKEGRLIFDNIRKITLYLLSDAFSEIILILSAVLSGLHLPLLAPQILWINLITDGFPNIALAFEPADKFIMKEKAKERSKRQILDFPRYFLIALISLATAAANLALFIYIYKSTGDIERARTIVFASLGIDSLLYVFSIRSLHHSVFSMNLFSNKILLISIVGGFLLQIIGIYFYPLQKILRVAPLGLFDWFMVFGLGVVIILIIEIFKFIFFKIKTK